MTTVNSNLFGENLYEVISMIRSGSNFKGVSNVKEKSTDNSDRYNHFNLTFDYEGKRYTINYKENSSDLQYVSELLCLGEVIDLEEKITKEDLIRSEMYYKEQLALLTKKNKELNEFIVKLNY